MIELPVGTLTFVLTDIEGSTRLWEREPAAMGAAMVRHDALFAGAVEQHSGFVVRPRGEGDSRFSVFPGARDAVAAAAEFQEKLYREAWPVVTPLRVRIALHTGEADLWNGDYYGTTVNRCARIRALAHGGQTLLSDTTAQLVRDSLPEGVILQNLGEHELKDLATHERIFQILIAGLPAEFPPLSSPTQRPTNLPAETTTFIGREREIQTVRRRLLDPDVRLITLVGPGGSGKTRIALRVAQAVLPDFQDGVFFVPLAAIHDPMLIIPTVAQALGVQTTGEEMPIDALREYLLDKKLLLVLDNFDHLLDGSPQLAELLSICPRLKILVTSRESPRLRGNQEIAVMPLDVPDPTQLPSMVRLLNYASVRLFVERAREVAPDFELTQENAATIAAICRRLDGLPLAIELAAARIRIFSPQAILTRLDRRLQLLTGGPRDVPARQQTLRGAIAWSYDLLEKDEQSLFRQLAVFQGGFSLEAAGGVCCNPPSDTGQPGEGIGFDDVLIGIDSLVSKSLLRSAGSTNNGEDPRFAMLQTIQEYGLEQLLLAAEDTSTRRQHALYFLELAEAGGLELPGREQPHWLKALERDHDNMRAALGWLYDANEVELGLRLASALWPFWDVRGYFAEGRGWLDRALTWEGSPDLRARALTGAGTLAWSQGNYPEATTLHNDALALYRELQDQAGIAFALNNLGMQAWAQGDHHRATALCQESLALYRELGHQFGIADAVNNLGVIAQYQGDLTSAESLYLESLTMSRELADEHRIADALYNLGEIAYYQNEHLEAWDRYHESLLLRQEIGSRRGAPLCLAALASVAAGLGKFERAARLCGAAQALLEAMGVALDSTEQARFDSTIATVQAELGPVASDALWTEGHMMLVDEAIDYGLVALDLHHNAA